MMKRTLLGFFVIVALVFLILYSQFRTAQPFVSGIIETDEIRLGSRVGGRVKQVLVKEGDRVAAGMPLIEFEPFDLLERERQAIAEFSRTQLEAMQFAFVIMLPSILLSGFVFPRSEMPTPIYWASFAIPATYFIEILRGIVLRGASLANLATAVTGLTVCCLVVLLAAVSRFRKRVG